MNRSNPRLLRFLVVHQVPQTDRPEVLEYAFVQRRPQVVREALLVILAVFLAAALRCIDRFIHRENDVGDRYLRNILGQAISTAWTAYAIDQVMPPQLAEKLLQIGERDLLARADLRERNRPPAVAHCKIDHCRYRESSFGRQSHGPPL